MFKYDITDKLKNKLKKLTKRDNILIKIFKRKLIEIINKNKTTINTYKNLKSPQHEFKRIHLKGNIILIFKVTISKNHILFVDILHRDYAYKKI